jgi:hypothetical protein
MVFFIRRDLKQVQHAPSYTIEIMFYLPDDFPSRAPCWARRPLVLPSHRGSGRCLLPADRSAIGTPELPA